MDLIDLEHLCIEPMVQILYSFSSMDSETVRSILVESLIRNILNLGHWFRNLCRLKIFFIILALTAIFFGRAKLFLANLVRDFEEHLKIGL